MTYKEPPKYVCEVDDFDVDLGLQAGLPEADGTLLMHVNMWTYRGRVVRFAFTLRIRTGFEQYHPVCEVDTCEGEVHRHQYDRAGDRVGRKRLAVIPEHGQEFVNAQFEAMYDYTVTSAAREVTRWRTT